MALGSRRFGDLIPKKEHNKAELFFHRSFSWKSKAKFPFYKNIYGFDIIAHLDGFILFGGGYQESYFNKQQKISGDIYFESSLTTKFTLKSNKRTKLGRLQLKRVEHSVIEINKKILVIGGKNNKSTEICELNNIRIICSLRKPVLNNFCYYPALVIVYSDTAKYC